MDDPSPFLAGSGPALLIDARNTIYRSVYAGMSDRNENKYHHFVIFLRQLASWINIKHPTSVHIFWDAPRETVWRRAVLSSYKDRTSSNYVEGLAEHLAKCTEVAKDFFKIMGVRQYERKQMEADDLIYAAASVMHPHPTYVVSNDSDMVQIQYRFSSCTVYVPSDGSDAAMPAVNPAYLKALAGDKADSIMGYSGIGPIKGTELLKNPGALQEFLTIKGPTTFHRNLLLIDLSMCPRLLANTLYIHKVIAKPVVWDKAEINALIMRHRVNGLQQEFSNLVMPFKNLI